MARLFGQYASQPGNDAIALAAVLRRPDDGPLTVEDAGQRSRVRCWS